MLIRSALVFLVSLGLLVLVPPPLAVACDPLESVKHGVGVQECREGSTTTGTSSDSSDDSSSAPAKDPCALPGGVAHDCVWIIETPLSSVESIATRVATQIVLPAPTPRFGPDPNKNRWKMIPVGYPVQLWSDGRTTIDRSAAAEGLSVALHATPGDTTFAMGDGNSVTCHDQHSWTGTAQGSCHYRYSKQSPRGTPYTITATTVWTVAWRAGGTTGIVILERSATATLMIGELQAVVER